MDQIKEVSSAKCSGGLQKVFEHPSKELCCNMKFAVYLPSAAVGSVKLPIVYFLSGLDCTHEDFVTKSGFQRYAEQYKLIVVVPDTRPRVSSNKSGDVITESGFYVDATKLPWSRHYKMYSYVTEELREIIQKNFPNVDAARTGISGHSMGGHGALISFFKNPQIYKAVSAFAPISNPINSAWGQRCMNAYLGNDIAAWREYDATELVRRQPRRSTTILIDQGANDEWLKYIVPKNFVEVCQIVGQPLNYNERDSYDHGYYFISTFIGDHLKFLADALWKLDGI